MRVFHLQQDVLKRSSLGHILHELQWLYFNMHQYPLNITFKHTKTNALDLPDEKADNTLFLIVNSAGTPSPSKNISVAFSLSCLFMKLLAIKTEFSFGSTLSLL